MGGRLRARKREGKHATISHRGSQDSDNESCGSETKDTECEKQCGDLACRLGW